MDEIEVGTVVYLPPGEVYEFLIDFRRYARYSEYLRSVSGDGDGGSGTEYALRFAWWKVGYTVRSRVTGVDPPERIGFEVTSGLHAEGEWRIEAAPGEAPDGGDASRVRFVVRYDPATVTGERVDLPALVSLEWVVEKAKPFVEEEARRVVERIVADLEGERREVDLTIS